MRIVKVGGGPKRGEPQGYAFVEYNTKEEAKLAKEKMKGRLARGRPLFVRLASEKLPEDIGAQKTVIGATSNPHPTVSTASGPVSKSANTAAIKNKLTDLEEVNNRSKRGKQAEDS